MVWLVSPASAATAFSNTAAIPIPLQGTSSATELGTYPSDISVTGLSGTISDLTVTLSNIVDTNGNLPDLSVLLEDPEGNGLSLLTGAGGFLFPQDAPNGLTVTLSDTGTTDSTFGSNLGTSSSTGDSGSVTIKPADFTSDFTNGATNDTFPSPAPSFSKAAPTGSATLASAFNGSDPNGTWKLFVTENAEGDGGGTGAGIEGGWSVSIATASAASTSTSLSSSPNPSFTSGLNNSVTFTATVTSSGSPVTTGTVEFANGGTDISGCGAAALNASGVAACTTSFTTEGDDSITAAYGGTSSFAASNGALTQEVDRHTVVSGSTYSNPGQIAISDTGSPPAPATPYPSHVFVSGLTGTIANVEVTLNNINYAFAPDLDVMLVGPQGGSEILVSGVGPDTGTTSAAGLTLNFDDSASSMLANGTTLPANTAVLTKPVDYSSAAGTDTFPSPAPAGPYGTPGTRGSSTLGDQFDGTNPNGTWSLYVVSDGAGDGGGAITGGWSLTFTLGSESITNTTVTGSPDPSFSSPPNQTVVLTASVTSGSPATPVTSGTVDFTADGTTVSGCGAVALNGSGQATCTTTFSTEADFTIQALYSGTTSFAESSDTTTQEVDNHTTVVAPNQFANAGAITLNNPTSSGPSRRARTRPTSTSLTSGR